MRRVALFISWTLLVVVLTSVTVTALNSGGIARPLRYEIPEGYHGWVLVQFADPSCPDLRADGLFEVLTVGGDGRACTSAALQTGWRLVEYVATGATASARLDTSLITIKSTQPPCGREQFYVRASGQTSIPPEPADWRFCGASL